MQRIAFVAAAINVVAVASDAPATAPLAPASIPFASRNIFTWQADGEKGIWVQSNSRKWYYGEFMAPCWGVQFREGVRFKFGPAGELDRWGAIIIPDVPECLFKSFTLSPGPPPKKAPAPSAAPASKPSGTQS
jgi:hypothetical protein